MINFLESPVLFRSRNIKLSALSGDVLYKIAKSQLKYATTIKQAKNFLVNLIETGKAKIINIKNLVFSVFHKMTRFIFISTPVVSHFTSLFRNVAYRRLLEGMFDAWRLGALDKKDSKPKRDEDSVTDYLKNKAANPRFRKKISQLTGSGWGTAPFYEEYLLGYDGVQPSELKKRALKVVKKDIGTRTMSELLKFMHDSVNPFRVFKQLYDQSKKSDANVEVAPFLKALVMICFSLSYPATAVFFAIKATPVLAVLGLFYYNPREAFVKETRAWGVFKKKLFKEVNLYVDSVDLDGHIPAKSVFVEDAMSEFENLSKTEPRKFTRD